MSGWNGTKFQDRMTGRKGIVRKDFGIFLDCEMENGELRKYTVSQILVIEDSDACPECGEFDGDHLDECPVC